MTSIALYPEEQYRHVIGMISGTSADGVDIARVVLPPAKSDEKLKVASFSTVPYPSELKSDVMMAAADRMSLRETARLNQRLGEFFAEVAAGEVAREPVSLIASHGQTVCHLPEYATTLQLGDGSIIANRTGVLTVCDFRTADMALGGQGAPLVPLFDSYLLSHPGRLRVAVNLGGIANITVLMPDQRQITAWDTGPANSASDAFCRLRGYGEFDSGGELAARGQVKDSLLETWLSHNYFAKVPPKSTGLEDFGEYFVESISPEVSLEDGLRSLLALSAQTLVDSIASVLSRSLESDLVFAGGGTSNHTLMSEISTRMERAAKGHGVSAPQFMSFRDFGVEEDCREAVAFAYLGDRTVRGLTGSVPGTTGAERAAVLGKVCFPSPKK